MSLSYISYSAWKEWMICPFRHKLLKIDRIRGFSGNAHSCFGTAVHSTVEKLLLLEQEAYKNGGTKDDSFDSNDFFLQQFLKEISSLDEIALAGLDLELVKQMKLQAKTLIPQILPTLRATFGNYKLVSVEQELKQPIDRNDKLGFSRIHRFNHTNRRWKISYFRLENLFMGLGSKKKDRY